MSINIHNLKIFTLIDFSNIKFIFLNASVNQHAQIEIQGILKNDNKNNYDNKSLIGEKIQIIFDNNGQDEYLFGGVITKILIQKFHDYSTATIEGISSSFQFDLKKNSRSFQDVSMTYSDIMDELSEKNKKIICTKGLNTKIVYPIIQYQETDWEFIKRMASHFNTVVIPEICYGFPQVSFGIVEGKEYILNDNNNYTFQIDASGFRKKKIVCQCKISDFIFIEIEDYNNYNLGDKIYYKGYKLIVFEKYIEMKDGLLNIKYILGFEQKFGLLRSYNNYISGMSILGNVIETKDEFLKIHLDIDKTQSLKTAYYFSWKPQTGNLLYCMPKKGTRVSLYFPDKDEKFAFSTECIRTNDGNNTFELRKTNFRQFLTEDNKCMTLAPSLFHFYTKSKEGTNTIYLNDYGTILMDSPKAIHIKGKGQIKLKAKNFINIVSKKYLQISKTDVPSGIEMRGNEINYFTNKFYRSGDTSKAAVASPKEDTKSKVPVGLFLGSLLAMIPAFVGQAADVINQTVLASANVAVVDSGTTINTIANSLAKAGQFNGVATGAYISLDKKNVLELLAALKTSTDTYTKFQDLYIGENRIQKFYESLPPAVKSQVSKEDIVETEEGFLVCPKLNMKHII